MRLLIIDDENDLCLLMKTYFIRRGFEVKSATTLTEGLELLYQFKPTHLFLDYNLPDGLGWDSISAIYNDFPDLHINLMSAFNPQVPNGLVGADVSIWRKPISFKSLDSYFIK
jgi:DNA-binding response OmpR family regulator